MYMWVPLASCLRKYGFKSEIFGEILHQAGGLLPENGGQDGVGQWACLQTYLKILLPTFLTNPLSINMFLKMLLFSHHIKLLKVNKY